MSGVSGDKLAFNERLARFRDTTDEELEDALTREHPDAIAILCTLKSISPGQEVIYHTGIHLGTLPQAAFLAEIAYRLTYDGNRVLLEKRSSGTFDEHGNEVLYYIAIGRTRIGR
jgi:hypothetical protein